MCMHVPPDERRPVETVTRAIEIVEYLKQHGEGTLDELAEYLGCAKSTVHRHVRTLETNSFVVAEGDRYRLGTRFLDLGIVARDRHSMYREVKPKVDELARVTEEKLWYFIEEHGQSIHVYGAEGKGSVHTAARVGRRNYLHQHAAGKAILAYLPDEQIEQIVEYYGLPAQTPQTITEPARLRAEIDEIREEGVAFNREESVEGLHAVGAPIVNGDGVAIGAISISGPANRLRGERFDEELPALLLGAVNELSVNIAHATPPTRISDRI